MARVCGNIGVMKKTFTFAVLAAALALSPQLSAEPTATPAVRAKQDTLLTTARWPRKTNRTDAVRALWRGWGDWEAIAEASVGSRVWDTLEEVHRTRMASLLSDIAALNWLRRVDGSPDWGLTWVREETIGKRRVVVSLLRAGGTAVDLRWVVERRGEDWRLVDLVTEGSSLVEAQRTSFARVMAKGGVDRLFVRLSQKREELMKEVVQ